MDTTYNVDPECNGQSDLVDHSLLKAYNIK